LAYKKPIKRTEREWAALKHWLENPTDAIKDWFKVTPDDWQGDVLNGLFKPTSTVMDRIAMKAAHGPGKTAIDAWAGLIFLNCYENCRVVATAPTFAQLHDVLFPEFAKWSNKLPERMQDEWVISGGHIRHKLAPYDWFAVARTSNQPANLQGFHGSHLLILADEGSAIPPPVFEVIEGALSEAGEDGKVAKLLVGGNPNFNSGELHDAFYKNRDLYDRITITGDKPLLTKLEVEQGGYHEDHGRVYYSPRVKKKYCDIIAKKYGIDSAVYDVRVRGIFPRISDDAIFPLEWAERAALKTPPPFDNVADGFSVICDPSRGGAAETAIGVARKGCLVEIEGHKGMTSAPQVSNQVHEVVLRYKAMGLHLNEIIVDQPGVGGGVIDNLRRDFNYPVRGYDGGKPLVKGVDPDEDCKMFANRRARDHWALRRKLEQNTLPIPYDEVMLAQMASIKYHYNKTEKIQVEGKQDMKDRLGPEASPDRSDVLVMASAPYYSGSEVTSVNITEEDIVSGDDRPTTEYREAMDMGLV
jgi:hypothetical protein